MFERNACAPCEFNPRNRPAPSARVERLLRIRSWQDAGAVFLFGDLRPEDWDGLAALRHEIQRLKIEKMKQK